MIVETDRLIPEGYDALTVWPFIFIRPAKRDDAGLVLHELQHYQEQRAAWVLPWLVRYWRSPQFRFEAEARGYRAQINAGAISLTRATLLLMTYGTGYSIDEATQALQQGSDA